MKSTRILFSGLPALRLSLAHSIRPPRAPAVIFCLLLVCALLLPGIAPARAEPNQTISFGDYRLEKKVREALGKMEGDITIADAQSLLELDFSNPGENIPDEDRVRDISALAYFTNLYALRAYNNALSDISPLAGLSGLKYLDLGGNQISDLSPLAGLTELKEVSLWYNGEIRDLSPLAASKGLVALDAKGNQIADVSPLADHAELEYLDLADNQIRDAGSLAGLSRLIVLRLANNPVDDWSALASAHAAIAETDFDPAWRGASEPIVFDDPVLERKVRAALSKAEGDIVYGDALSIRELNIGRDGAHPEEEKVRSIEALRSFENLVKLDAWYNEISDLSPLSGLGELTLLNIDGNPIASLDALAGLSNLSVLSAACCGIEDVGALAGLERLEYLDVASNRIADMAPLAGLMNLRALRLQGNLTADFEPLRAVYARLEERDFELLFADNVSDEPIEIAEPSFEAALRRAMNIYDRPITQKDAFLTRALVLHNEKTPESEFSNLEPLKWFVNLERLAFNSNPITDLSPLAGLTSLRDLNVAFSQVADLSPLSGLTNLESLNLRNCQVADVRPLAGLTSLRYLDLTDNPLKDVSALDALLPDLTIER